MHRDQSVRIRPLDCGVAPNGRQGRRAIPLRLGWMKRRMTVWGKRAKMRSLLTRGAVDGLGDGGHFQVTPQVCNRLTENLM